MKISRNKLIMVKEQEIEYRNKIRCKEDFIEFVDTVIKPFEEPEEVLYLVTLTSANTVQAFMEVARGGLNCCMVHEADIYKRVLVSNANKFILLHNHPSGIVKPSLYDKELTEGIKASSKMLGLIFLDHIIAGDKEYKSCFE